MSNGTDSLLQSFSLRPAGIADLAFLTGAIRSMARDSEGLELDPETVDRGVRGLLERPENGAYYLLDAPVHMLRSDVGALRAGAPAGSTVPVACLMVTKEWSDWNANFYWWIQSVYVEPSLRGRGVFGRFFELLRSEARRKGVKVVRLYVDKRNGSAIRSYAKCGFTDDHYLLMECALS